MDSAAPNPLVLSRKTRILNNACSSAMKCPLFLQRWDRYKQHADKFVEGKELSVGAAEFQMMSEQIEQEWKALVDRALNERAEAKGITKDQLIKDFVDEQIFEIRELGYNLDDKMEATLEKALSRFFMCNVLPAPFSVHGVLASERENSNITLTVAEHGLQLATHWLRHPPCCLSCVELQELCVLAIFHDVYYYDDFPHHDQLGFGLFQDYITSANVKDLVSGHLKLAARHDLEGKLMFDNDYEALQQEWVQMDWYFTLMNSKERSRKGDQVVLPLEFFHHQIGKVLTKETLINTEQ